MSFETKVKDFFFRTAWNINMKSDKEVLNYLEVDKIVNISYKVGKWFFIIAESFVMYWFLVTYLPDKYDNYYVSILLMLLIIYLYMMFGTFKTKNIINK